MLSDRLPLTEIPDGLANFVEMTLMDSLTAGAERGSERAPRWCSQWREHPEAVHRLAAIYDEWCMMLAGEDAAPHLFLRDVLDYHLSLLVDPDRGTFRACRYGHVSHRRLDSKDEPGAGDRELWDQDRPQ